MHPNPDGYAIVIQNILKALEPAIRKQKAPLQ
jgi:lysophospholipase L1-like esterase